MQDWLAAMRRRPSSEECWYVQNISVDIIVPYTSADSLTFQALTALDVKRRVILTGTPIQVRRTKTQSRRSLTTLQNDLTEYFSLLDFANPGYLGTRLDFRKNFELAIIRGRDADASDADKTKCNEKLKQLNALVMPLIIRRTNDLLSKYLPVKYEQVVFCRLSPFQLALYRLFITSPEIKALLRGKDSQPLKAINVLKKLCNHPELLDLPADLRGCEHLIPEDFVGAKGDQNMKSKGSSSRGGGRGGGGGGVHCDWGGKFLVLERCVSLRW